MSWTTLRHGSASGTRPSPWRGRGRSGAHAVRLEHRPEQALVDRVRDEEDAPARCDVLPVGSVGQPDGREPADRPDALLGHPVRGHSGRDAFLVGGPDGLSRECSARANERWSLSNLTLPHGLVRIVVAEALYRAWSLLENHPYHRA